MRAVFDSVAPRYDLMNDLMSGGIHRFWKAQMVGWLKPRPGQVLLDAAGEPATSLCVLCRAWLPSKWLRSRASSSATRARRCSKSDAPVRSTKGS